MARNCEEEKWVDSISIENEVEEEETLSLCDLPTNQENPSKKEAAKPIETQEDFNFGSCGGSVLPESEMCAADDVFFQGQILPLRHSVSSENGLAGQNPTRFLSRSQSMDHCYSGGFSSINSRSSSIRSHHSSSSSSTTSTKAATRYSKLPRVRTRNQFHSHPSPTPQIRFSTIHQNVDPRIQKSTIWSFFRVGLVRTPEIELKNLKIRNSKTHTTKNFGSRNSTSSTSSSTTTNGKSNITNDKDVINIEKKKKQKFYDKNVALFGGCKCSINAIETVPSKKIGIIKRSISVKEEKEREILKKTKQQKEGKQVMSRYRTFEWLKQLSVEGGPEM